MYMNSHFLWATMLLLPLLGCQQRDNASQETEKAELPPYDSLLVGAWENVSLKVTVNTIDNTDSIFTLMVPAGEWENKLGIKPIRTEYAPNNTYRSEYRNLQDSVIRITRGIWNVFSDTLLLIEPEATYQYLMRYRNDIIEFRSQLDWDGDGQDDDEYLGLQRKLKK